MILDERNEFADAVALNTGAAGSYLIGDQIDLGVARDIGNGEPLLPAGLGGHPSADLFGVEPVPLGDSLQLSIWGDVDNDDQIESGNLFGLDQ